MAIQPTSAKMNLQLTDRHLRTYAAGIGMPTRVHVAIVLLAQALLSSTVYGQEADWTPTEAELARLRDGAVLVEADGATDRSSGDVRAAVQIKASAERI